jgi:hypothetical protein
MGPGQYEGEGTMRRGRLGVALGVSMAAVLALGFGVAQAAPIPEITFGPASSAAACFNCPAGGPFSASPVPVFNLSYSGSTWGGESLGGLLSVGAAPASPNVNNLGSLALGTGAAVYTGTTFRLEVTFVLSPPGVVVPGNNPEFTAVLLGAVTGSGTGGVTVDFDNTAQHFVYSAPGEAGMFSFSVNDIDITPGETVPLTGRAVGSSTHSNGVPEPGVALLLGSVLAALAFVGHRVTRSR